CYTNTQTNKASPKPDGKLTNTLAPSWPEEKGKRKLFCLSISLVLNCQGKVIPRLIKLNAYVHQKAWHLLREHALYGTAANQPPTSFKTICDP
uniref:Uncharacterized protein n=1 Tax=Cyprinus carpio carpio TaxID=630221 RepID=A0A9J7ZJH2_CYPCA